MLQRMNRSVFITSTLLNVGVPEGLLPFWKTVTLWWLSQRPNDAAFADTRVHLLLDTAENTLAMTCDILGANHKLKLLVTPDLAKMSVLGAILGWWVIEALNDRTPPDYGLLPAEVRALILEAV